MGHAASSHVTISAKIILDSIGPSRIRLTTFELTYPRFVHSELMTHRAFSRNAASSRAIPFEKTVAQVKRSPAMPIFWGRNQKGMQAWEELDDVPRGTLPASQCESWADMEENLSTRELAKERWLTARNAAIAQAEHLHTLGLHKQIVNRVLEPWLHMTTLVSATDWNNFFFLRTHRDAQPEFRELARCMWKEYKDGEPKELEDGEWHLPFIQEEDIDRALKLWTLSVASEQLRKVSTGRCARVSYLTHDGKRDLLKDIDLHDRLLKGRDGGEPMHMSPFEHVAQALTSDMRMGNFRGWKQYRKLFFGEEGPSVLTAWEE